MLPGVGSAYGASNVYHYYCSASYVSGRVRSPARPAGVRPGVLRQLSSHGDLADSRRVNLEQEEEREKKIASCGGGFRRVFPQTLMFVLVGVERYTTCAPRPPGPRVAGGRRGLGLDGAARDIPVLNRVRDNNASGIYSFFECVHP